MFTKVALFSIENTEKTEYCKILLKCKIFKTFVFNFNIFYNAIYSRDGKAKCSASVSHPSEIILMFFVLVQEILYIFFHINYTIFIHLEYYFVILYR